MRRSLLLLSLCAASVHTVIAQSIGFTVFPQQVVTGLTYTVAWNSDGQSATIDLLRNGHKADTLFTSDGTVNTFQWSVQDDYSGGTNYALQISSGGATALTNNLDVIEDEDGLVVSGSTITAPSATSTVDLASVTAVSITSSVATTASVPTTGSETSTTSNTAPSVTSSTASTTSSAGPTPSNSSRITVAGGLGGAVIAGIVIGLLGAAAVGAGGVWLCLRRRRLAANKSGDDHVDSFLALGRRGRASGTIKGTSPEVQDVSEVPHDRHELNAGGIVGYPELYGELFPPWGSRNQKRFYSETRPVQEASTNPTRYELPGDNP